MPTLNIHKAVQEIRLDDSPESPVFKLDLTDSSINKKTPFIAGCYVVYQRVLDDLKESKITTEEAKVKLASIYKQIISAMLSTDAYEAIYQYIKGASDAEPEEVTLAMSPIVEYLLQEFDAILTMNRSKVVRQYLEDSDGTDAI